MTDTERPAPERPEPERPAPERPEPGAGSAAPEGAAPLEGAPAPDDGFSTPFEVLEPPGPPGFLVLCSPHSGRCYPPSFLAASRLPLDALRRSEDCFVDLLVAGAVPRGVPLLRALFPRAYLDANREPYELDPRMFAGPLPAHANTRSLRVAGGLGTIARVVGEAQEIYRRRLTVEEAVARIEGLHRPFHAALRGLMDRARHRHGVAALLDCHSMPSASVAEAGGRRADVVLGDRFGTSCAPALTDAAEEAFAALGYKVRRNRPYAGGFITESAGDPVAGRHALQLEINRALYMDEASLTPLPAFAAVAADLLRVVDALARLDPRALAPRAAAAE